MSAETWSTVGGVRWVAPSASTGPVQQASVLVVLGRGYAHQGVPAWGCADAVAQLLQRALRRPVDLGDRTLAVEARVETDLLHTTVRMTGPVAALARRIAWLDDTLREPGGLDLEAPPRGREHPLRGWGRELGVWWGVGPATLSADVNPYRTGPPELLVATVGALHPDRGCPVVVAVSDPALVGSAFGATTTTAPVPDPAGLRWHDVGRASVVSPYLNHLLTARVAASWAGEVATSTVLGSVRRALELSGGTSGLRVVAPRLGRSRLVAVTAAPSEDTRYDDIAVRGALASALAAAEDTVDAEADAAVDRWRQVETEELLPGLPGLATTGLLTGTAPTSDHRRAELEGLEPVAVAREIRALLQHVLIGVEKPEQALPTHPMIDREPVGPGSIRDGLSVHRSAVALPMADGVPVRVSLTRRGSTLESERGAPREQSPGGPVVQRLDLKRVVARVDYGEPGWSILIDDRDNRIEVPWPTLSGRRRLERIVARAVPDDRRLRLDGDPRLTAALRAREKRGRVVLIGVAAFLLLVFGLIAAVNLRAERDAPVTVTTVPAGTEVTLGNGARWRVSGARLVTTVPSRPQVAADVRVCGGRADEDDARSRTRNTTSAYAFALLGTSAGVTGPIEGRPLASVTVPEGSCVEGSIAFDVPATVTDVSGLSVLYTNSADDAVTWSL